jgi:haloalkane dehalogenase
MAMNVLRTPDERFATLPGYPFEPHYVETSGLRMHYVDEGPRDADPVLMLHGEPSWSYLYRTMIPLFANAGLRAIAPDLIGFGRSDKPADRDDYTYQRHVDWVRGFLTALDLKRITLVCQDWGGLIGLRLLAEEPHRFARVVAANTALATGDAGPPGPAFEQWLKFSQEAPELPIGMILQNATVTDLPPEVVAAYDAPFPDESYKAGARQFPALVPITPDDPASQANRLAWQKLEKLELPFVTAFSDQDAVLGHLAHQLHERIPGAQGQPHDTLVGGGHFLQEDIGPELAQVTLDLIGRTPDAGRS